MPRVKLLNNSSGMSLAETLIAISIASVLSIFAGISIVNSGKNVSSAGNQTSVVETATAFKRALSANTSGQSSCSQILKAASGSTIPQDLTSVPRINVQIVEPGTSQGVQGGQKVSGIYGTFQLSSLYITDISKISTAGSGAQIMTTYMGTVWLEGQFNDGKLFARRSITALTFTVDGTGQISNCNSVQPESKATNCTGLAGFTWDENGQSCDSSYLADGGGHFGCQDHLSANDSSTCVPMNIACTSPQEIAKIFGAGSISGCTTFQSPSP